ncbi:MAG: CAP domain-containing protein [Pirellulaceae bacterium]
MQCLRWFAGLVIVVATAAVYAEDPQPAPAAENQAGTSSPEQPREVAPEAGAVVTTARPVFEHPVLLQMLSRNNQLRRSRGLWAHRLHPALTQAAQDHANYMARTHDFNHYSNAGPSGRAFRYGFRGGVLENIAMGYGDVATTFYGWQTSGGHWANMTSQTTDAGFGYAVSQSGTPFWVAVYGTAPAESPAPAADSPVQPASANETVAADTGDAASTPPSLATAPTTSTAMYSQSSWTPTRGRIFRRRR